METVSFVRAPGYDDPAFFERMDRLVAPVFSFERVREGATVLLKPNFLGAAPPERAATTHPRVVDYFIRRFRARGCRVLVGDSPAVERPGTVAERSGVLAVMRAHGAEPADFAAEAESVRPNPFAYARLPLARALAGADLVVNLAKVKSHGQMTLTLATKNLFGLVVGVKKAGWHLKAGKNREAFAEMLLSVACHANAALHVLDGVVAMEGNGPFSGTPRATGFLAASTDPHALDRFACRLLGVDPAEVPTVALAAARGLPGAREGGSRLVGDDPGAFRIRGFRRSRPGRLDWNLPGPFRRFVEARVAPYPHVDPAACVGCAKCARACPAGAIAMARGVAAIRHAACIHCFCCQEICPAGAIAVREPLIPRLAARLAGRRPV